MPFTDLPVIRNLAAFFRRTLVRGPTFIWNPGRIGPTFEWLGYSRIRILEGALENSELEITTDITDAKADIFASINGQRIGRAYVERDPPGRGIVLWDIAVKEDYRRQGVASIMTYCIFRELLSMQEVASFRIRMMRLFKPGDKNIELQNVGIGVIGNRLGFTPEFSIEKLLQPANVVDLSILPPREGFPPSFKIIIRSFPLVLIAFVLDIDTLKPVEDLATYVKLTRDERIIYNWVRQGLIVVGNGNYWLRRDGLDQFVNHLATDEFEARVFRRRVRGV